MIDFYKFIINFVQTVSFCLLLLVGVVGVVYEIIGHGNFVRFLSKLGIIGGFEKVWIIGGGALIALLITYYIKSKM